MKKNELDLDKLRINTRQSQNRFKLST